MQALHTVGVRAGDAVAIEDLVGHALGLAAAERGQGGDVQQLALLEIQARPAVDVGEASFENVRGEVRRQLLQACVDACGVRSLHGLQQQDEQAPGRRVGDAGNG